MVVRMELCFLVAACLMYQVLFKGLPLPKAAGGKRQGKVTGSSNAEDNGKANEQRELDLHSPSNVLVRAYQSASPSVLAKYVTMIRKCVGDRNLEAAKASFEPVKLCDPECNNIVCNAFLDACVGCRDLRAAEDFMDQIGQAGMVDVVSSTL